MAIIEIRKANINDINAIESIYNEILDDEVSGVSTTGWLPGIYPVKSTAESALQRDDLFVMEYDGTIVSSAVFNKIQVDAYLKAHWEFPATDDEIFVVHTLVVSPKYSGLGLGKIMIDYYEQLGKNCGAKVLRLDTNMKNKRAFNFYTKLGYRFAGTQPCVFNNIPDVNLALFEKKI